MPSLLYSLARSSARATGRALSAHVVPDSLIPSWKTRKAVSSGLSLLNKAARKTGKSASAKSAKQFKRPAPTKPKQAFNKNAWSQGRAIAPAAGYGEPPPSRPASSSGRSLKQSAARLRQQFSDLRSEPRLVAQMGLDILKQEYRLKKNSFLSEVKEVNNNYRQKKTGFTSLFKKRK
jgi:hypothetical protein